MLRAALRRLPSWRERMLLANERRRLLALISRGGICAEIGVWQGDFAAQILETCRPIKLHLIDPWRYTPSYERSFYGRSGDSQTTLDTIHDSVHERFASAIAAGVVEVHRETSEAAARLFPDDYFDFVYVDGDHTYEFVRRDLAVYRPKLRTDAVLAGDDYALRGWWEWGVKRAVDEAVNEHAYEPIWLARQFVLRLPP